MPRGNARVQPTASIHIIDRCKMYTHFASVTNRCCWRAGTITSRHTETRDSLHITAIVKPTLVDSTCILYFSIRIFLYPNASWVNVVDGVKPQPIGISINVCLRVLLWIIQI